MTATFTHGRGSRVLRDKAELELMLTPYSRIPGMSVFKQRYEQYQTPTSIAAEIAWTAYIRGELSDSTVLDLGCGTGVLTVSTLLVSARRAVCIDIDGELLGVAVGFISTNYPELLPRIIFVQGDATEFEVNSVDMAVLNPPFGVYPQNRGLDIRFLESALRNARVVYSIHKYSSGFFRLLERLANTYNVHVSWLEVLNLEIPMMYTRHKRRVYRVKTVIIGLERKG